MRAGRKIRAHGAPCDTLGAAPLRRVRPSRSPDLPRRLARELDASRKKDISGQRLLQYQVAERIGAGGLGVVYRAIDLKLKRTVALKLLPAELTPTAEDRRRFFREARAWRALEHPNIGVVHSVEETEDGRLLIVMAYCDGPSLAARIDKDPISVDEAVAIVLQLLRGIEEAHARGIVHGDIKPRNLMFNALGVLKILDFGLARLHASPAAEPPSPVPGTLAYMSPEGATGAPADPRTDLWSSSVVLYEMLTRRRLFRSTNPQSILDHLLSGDPIPLEGIPEGFDRILGRALDKDYAQRYQTAAELIFDIEAEESHRQLAAKEQAAAALAAREHADGGLPHPQSEMGMRWVLASVAVLVLGAGITSAIIHLRRNAAIPTVALALGRVRLVQERYPEAVTEFEQVLGVDPHNDGAYRGLAEAYAAMGLPDKAIESWQRDISLHPDTVEPYTQLAKFEFNQGDYPAAAGDFRRALNLAPSNPAILSNLGAALAHAGFFDESRNNLEQSIRLAPSFSAWDNMGDLDLRQKHYADAAKDYGNALDFNNTDYRVWWNLAVADSRTPDQREKARRNFVQATRMCREALKGDPNDPLVLSDLAALVAAQPNGRQESLTLLARALALAPSNPRVEFNAAQAYAALGDRRDAQAQAEKLMASGFPAADIDLSPTLAELVRIPHSPAMAR
jgi:tetratricopeptide (TPR) repeat protein